MPAAAPERRRVRVGYEQTGFELDTAGTARAARRLREAIEERGEVEVVPIAQPAARPGLGGRIARGLARETTWFPWGLARHAAGLDLDLLHCPFPLAPPASPVPLVCTLNDVMAWEHPEWFGRALVLQHRLGFTRALRGAVRVLTPSRFAHERIVSVLRLDPERIEVVPYGVDPVFTPGPRDEEALARLGVAGDYVLCVGTLQPRKNLAGALAAFERRVAAGGDERLVVAGARGWRDGALAQRLGQSPARDRIHALGRVSEQDLVALYRSAACLLYPSRGEGFGFPVLEAMACATAVVCSGTTSLPEVAGGAAELVDPEDLQDIARGLGAVLDDAARREDLVRLGTQRAAQFTWERCARQTVAAYRAAAAAA